MIFKFTDYREFLKAEFHKRTDKNPSYTISEGEGFYYQLINESESTSFPIHGISIEYE